MKTDFSLEAIVGNRSVFFWRSISTFFIVIGLALAATAVRQKSVTVDEFQALPSGLAILKTGDFRLSSWHAPLIFCPPSASASFHFR